MPSVAASISAVLLWISVPLVSLTTQCLLTDHCTWGEKGADFGKPVTTTALHLLVVGGSLAAVSSAFCRSTTRDNQEDGYSVWQRLCFRLQCCAAVGTAFGVKYIVGHWALQVTPNASIYELFHCFTIVWIVLWARFITGEHLKSKIEAVACLGIVVGAALTAHDSFRVETKQGGRFSLLSLTLNLANGMLAGVVLALLRRTILQTRGIHVTIAEVTYWKMLIGSMMVFPLALAVEDVSFVLTRQQQMWLGISSAAILVYHLNLTFLCGLAPVPVVGVIESLKPLPAVGITALLQGLPPSKSWLFWIGSGVILVSAVSFKLSRTCFPREVSVGEPTQEALSWSQPTNGDRDPHEKSEADGNNAGDERKPLCRHSEVRRPRELL